MVETDLNFLEGRNIKRFLELGLVNTGVPPPPPLPLSTGHVKTLGGCLKLQMVLNASFTLFPIQYTYDKVYLIH